MHKERETKRISTINSVLGFIVNIVFLLIFSLIISIVIEWAGFYFDWWENRAEHSLTMLRTELNYASQSVKEAFTGANSGSWVSSITYYYTSAMYWFFHWSLKVFTFTFGESSSAIEYIDSAYNISLVFILRIFLIIFSLPIFIMVFIWGFVDGLVERDLRRYGAGRESSTIFEASRKLVLPLFILPFIVYLSFPTSIHPMYILAPAAIFQAVLYRILFSRYKKYL